MRASTVFFVPTVSALFALGIFVPAELPYLTAPAGAVVGYGPLAAGAVAFSVLIFAATLMLSSGHVRRWLNAAVAAILSFGAFVYLSLLVLAQVHGT